MKLLHPTNVKMKNSGLGDKAADWLASRVGSWPFVLGQLFIFAAWIAVNTMVIFQAIQFDPYPFFFFNLSMSCEAAFTAPIIMMSQNRQNEHDRHRAEVDFRTNREALELVRQMARLHLKPEEVDEIRMLWNPDDEGN